MVEEFAKRVERVEGAGSDVYLPSAKSEKEAESECARNHEQRNQSDACHRQILNQEKRKQKKRLLVRPSFLSGKQREAGIKAGF